jgi:hypothetical protein
VDDVPEAKRFYKEVLQRGSTKRFYKEVLQRGSTKRFYSETLGLRVSEEYAMLWLHIAGECDIVV